MRSASSGSFLSAVPVALEPLVRFDLQDATRRRPLVPTEARDVPPDSRSNLPRSVGGKGWTPRVNKSLLFGLRAGGRPGIPRAQRAVWALSCECVTFVQQRAVRRARQSGEARPVRV